MKTLPENRKVRKDDSPSCCVARCVYFRAAGGGSACQSVGLLARGRAARLTRRHAGQSVDSPAVGGCARVPVSRSGGRASRRAGGSGSAAEAPARRGRRKRQRAGQSVGRLARGRRTRRPAGRLDGSPAGGESASAPRASRPTDRRAGASAARGRVDRLTRRHVCHGQSGPLARLCCCVARCVYCRARIRVSAGRHATLFIIKPSASEKQGDMQRYSLSNHRQAKNPLP